MTCGLPSVRYSRKNNPLVVILEDRYVDRRECRCPPNLATETVHTSLRTIWYDDLPSGSRV
jgi:hypothetical protein